MQQLELRDVTIEAARIYLKYEEANEWAHCALGHNTVKENRALADMEVRELAEANGYTLDQVLDDLCAAREEVEERRANG